MSEDLSLLLMKMNSEKKKSVISHKNSIFKKFKFPLKDEEELDSLEEFLIQDKNFDNFVRKFIYNKCFTSIICINLLLHFRL